MENVDSLSMDSYQEIIADFKDDNKPISSQTAHYLTSYVNQQCNSHSTRTFIMPHQTLHNILCKTMNSLLKDKTSIPTPNRQDKDITTFKAQPKVLSELCKTYFKIHLQIELEGLGYTPDSYHNEIIECYCKKHYCFFHRVVPTLRHVFFHHDPYYVDDDTCCPTFLTSFEHNSDVLLPVSLKELLISCWDELTCGRKTRPKKCSVMTVKSPKQSDETSCGWYFVRNIWCILKCESSPDVSLYIAGNATRTSSNLNRHYQFFVSSIEDTKDEGEKIINTFFTSSSASTLLSLEVATYTTILTNNPASWESISHSSSGSSSLSSSSLSSSSSLCLSPQSSAAEVVASLFNTDEAGSVVVQTFHHAKTVGRVLTFMNNVGLIYYAFAVAKLINVIQQSGKWINLTRDDIINVTMPEDMHMADPVRDEIGLLVKKKFH